MALAPETPSTVQWCILVKIATLPDSRPSMTTNSHSGRDRSSGMPAMCPHRSASSRSPPGDGSAIRCTCRSMSKSSSVTQTGWSMPSGTCLSLRWNIGTPSIRRSSSSLNFAKS